MSIGLREKLTGYGLLLGGLAALLAKVGYAIPAFAVFVWLTAALISAYWIESAQYRPRLKRLFAPRRIGALYRRVLAPIALWPRDWRLYDKALLIALIYPIGIPLILWIYPGKPALLGGTEVLRAPEAAWQQVVVGGLICLQVFAFIKSASARAKGSERKFWLWLAVAVAVAVAGAGAFAFAVAVAFAVAFAVAVAGAFAVAFAVAVAGAGAGAFAFAFAVAFAVAVAGAFAVAFAVAVAGAGAGAFAFVGAVTTKKMTEKGHGNIAYGVLTVSLFAFVLGAVAIIPWGKTDEEDRVLFLFLGLLPLVNAVFDYISYSATLWLLRAGVRKPRIALLTGLADFAVAAVLFLALGATLVALIASINLWADVPLYPLVPVFHGIRIAPGDYLWLYLMMFSTVLPTALHAAVATFSLGSWLTGPARRALHGMIDNPDAVPAAAAPLLIGLYWTACLLIPLILFYGIYLLGQTHIDPAFDAYLRFLENIACRIGPASCPA